MLSNISSTFDVASISNICRLDRDVVGGIYTFIILIRWLFGNMILVCKPYSFPDEVSICNGFRTYMAIPPLVLFSRRCSISV